MSTILLIDDDPDFVEATRIVLESVPYLVLTAFSGHEGLKKAREKRPDLIILDIIMPGEDGFQTVEKLRSDPALAHVPVMMLTSLSDGLGLAGADRINAAREDNVEDYVNKPIRPNELLQRVERMLRMRTGEQNCKIPES